MIPLKTIEELIEKHSSLEKDLSSGEIDKKLFAEKSKEYSDINEIIDVAKKHISFENDKQELEKILNDQTSDNELKKMAETELTGLNLQHEINEKKLKLFLLPKDEADKKNAIIEIRAGTGGDEAGLFASDLMRMYSRYAENNNLKVKIMDIHETGVGGLKSATFSIEGPKAYGVYKYEGGVHRVQRIPKTESGGRVHTSAATVAVLPEAETAEVEINDSDIKIDTYRASGAGGQHVNKTESAIRLTHIPTGLVVTCQDESSQHKNKASAMKVLRSRLFALEQEKLNKDRDEMRKSLVSTGDRSAKIRTYNFPQGRITDHRINYTTHKLQVTLEGELDHLIEQLKLAEDSAKIE